MAERIEAHRRERPSHWRVREEPIRLGLALREELSCGAQSRSAAAAGTAVADAGVVLVDCLTLWISNCLWPSNSETPDFEGWRHERDEFITTLGDCGSEVIIVTNEVGTGIVPGNSAARLFRDEQGWLNQATAAVCDEVYFVTAGLPLCPKPGQTPPGHTTKPPR
jgi:adenosylcobinamide kinase/adenosylcobinamide-phosphate guanylyltransferase